MPSARIQLPTRTFLYTLDQLAMLLNIEETILRSTYIFFVGRTLGSSARKMEARNIAPEGDTPDWRVAEVQFIKFLRGRGFTIVGGPGVL